MDSKSPEDTNSRSISQEEGAVSTRWQDTLAELRYMLTTKDGWIGDYVRFFTCASLFVSMLTVEGLPLSSDAQHLAIEPEIQRLQGSFLWSQRSGTAAADATLGPPACAMHDRFDCLAASGYCVWSFPFRSWND